MARDYQINGESLVLVKGNVGSPIPSIIELGLAMDPINVTLVFNHDEINVNAWGKAPADVQWLLAEASVSMNLVHIDRDVLDACIREAMGGATAIGNMARAGQRMGGNNGRFAAGNHYIGLNITSPGMGKPWRFFYAYLAQNPVQITLGVERSIFQLNWRAVPYCIDPYGGSINPGAPNAALAQPNAVYGGGATGAILWDHNLDT